MDRRKKKGQELLLSATGHPIVYEVNTRVLLNELSVQKGKPITLATIPEELLDRWKELGFDAIWLMGVWTSGKLGIGIARTHESLREEYRRALPDLQDEDIIGSPYAISSYSIPRVLGGKSGLLSIRKRLRERGMGLFLDFVGNHTARDHRWVQAHPEYYVQGSGDETSHPAAVFETETRKGKRVIAFGKDPYFPGWTDTAQINIFHEEARTALAGELMSVASLCDGVRCDMAMLLLREVFQGTWGDKALRSSQGIPETEFWSDAIAEVKSKYPGFLFLAEVYWNMEWRLQQLGFDFTYDKRLYDRLLREGASAVYDHLTAEAGFQQRSIRFLENHDEPRIAEVLSNDSWHFAAVTIMSTVPGMAFFHDGQLEGRRIRVPVQLARRAPEPASRQVYAFYEKLIRIISGPPFQKGTWRLLNSKPAWQGNHTWRNMLLFWWQDEDVRRFVVVNYAPHNSQCYVDVCLEGVTAHSIEFKDMLSPTSYVREKNGLTTKGMYFDLPPYGTHVFEVLLKP